MNYNKMKRIFISSWIFNRLTRKLGYILAGMKFCICKSSSKECLVSLEGERESGRILKPVANNLDNYNDNCDIYYANTVRPFRYPFRLYLRSSAKEIRWKLSKQPLGMRRSIPTLTYARGTTWV